VELSPQKAAGQGFGSATGQYLDVYTKFDPYSLSGYGLRIERTPRFGNGVSFALYKYENGLGTALGPQQYSSAFLAGCSIVLYVEKGILRAEVQTSSPQQQSQEDSGLLHQVDLSAPIEQNFFGGFGVQHTGSVGGSRILLENMQNNYGYTELDASALSTIPGKVITMKKVEWDKLSLQSEYALLKQGYLYIRFSDLRSPLGPVPGRLLNLINGESANPNPIVLYRYPNFVLSTSGGKPVYAVVNGFLIDKSKRDLPFSGIE